MSELTRELHEELDAFDPRWKEHYSSIRAASIAAGVQDIYEHWLKTADGAKYTAIVKELPDHVGDSIKEAEVMRSPGSLPFGYDSLGWLPGITEERYSGISGGSAAVRK